jgi:glyceraldehyde-3-phosphate dehydrogenase/erythrose-4-phosphate dehydrogenase
MKRIAINGMGRTGRVMLRKLMLTSDWDRHRTPT